jgi:hypothetical protein
MRTHIQTAAMPGGEHTVVNVERALLFLFLGYIVGTVTDAYVVSMRGERQTHDPWHSDDCCLSVVPMYEKFVVHVV